MRSPPEFRLVNNCVLPTGLLYDVEEDLWASVEDGVVRLGMTDHSQTISGNILYANYRVEAGEHVDGGSTVATIEAAKWIGVVKAPFPGEVTALNSEVEDDAFVINQSPYFRGWMFEIEPEESPQRALSGFVDVEEAVELYREKMDRMGLNDCVHCEEFEI